RVLARKTCQSESYTVRKRTRPKGRSSAEDAKRGSGQEANEVKLREKSSNIFTSKWSCVVDAERRCCGVIESIIGHYNAKKILKDFNVVLVAVFDVEGKFSS